MLHTPQLAFLPQGRKPGKAKGCVGEGLILLAGCAELKGPEYMLPGSHSFKDSVPAAHTRLPLPPLPSCRRGHLPPLPGAPDTHRAEEDGHFTVPSSVWLALS